MTMRAKCIIESDTDTVIDAFISELASMAERYRFKVEKGEITGEHDVYVADNRYPGGRPVWWISFYRKKIIVHDLRKSATLEKFRFIDLFKALAYMEAQIYNYVTKSPEPQSCVKVAKEISKKLIKTIGGKWQPWFNTEGEEESFQIERPTYGDASDLGLSRVVVTLLADGRLKLTGIASDWSQDLEDEEFGTQDQLIAYLDQCNDRYNAQDIPAEALEDYEG